MKVRTTCESCDDVFIRDPIVTEKLRRERGRVLCKSCSTREDYALGKREAQRSAVKKNNATTFAKPWDERYGKERAAFIRAKLGTSLKALEEPNRRGTKNLEPYPFKGKTLEEIHGKEKAAAIKKKLSDASSGTKNPMYGKPSPRGSGNGWSGWYRGFFFRSLLELSYLVNEVFAKGLEAKTAETKEYRVKYKFDGRERSYFPDFVVGDIVIELKPSALLKSAVVRAKTEAAISYFTATGTKYVILTERDFARLSDESLKKLHDDGEIEFTETYEKKWSERR